MTSALSSLFNGLLISGTLTVSVWAVLRLASRRALNAATRYVVWWVALFCVMALPNLYMAWKSPARRVAPAVLPAITAPAAASAPVTITPMPAAPFAAVVVPVRLSRPDWIWRLILLWPIVSAAMLVRLTLSYVLLHRLKRRAREAPPEVQERAVTWLTQCGGARNGVRVLISDEIATPVAAGPRHPAILIPARLFDALTRDDLDRIGLHETAHLVRRDDYALVAQRTIEALLFFHPLILWIANRIDLEREIACDDMVIAATGRPRSYADCLARIVESGAGMPAPWPAAPAAENISHLTRRVDALLDKTRRAGAHLMKFRLAAIAATLLLVALAAVRAPALIAFVPRLAQAKLAAVLPARSRAPILPLPQQALAQSDLSADPAGTVVEDSTGTPIASVELRFKMSGMRELAADLETDRQGRFSAPGLPAGDYSLEVSKPNYAATSFRLRVPSPPLNLRMVHFGVIDGKVVNAAGRPLPGILRGPSGRTVGAARVTILARAPDTGELKTFRDVIVEDEGAYRIYNLPPGQYAVGLWYWGLDEGSGMQLYPDTAHPRFFTVKGGEEYNGIDFLVTPRPSSQIAGKVELPEGTKGPFQLALGMPEQPLLPLAQVISEVDGSFRFDKIPPGTYDLYASGPAMGYGSFETIFNPNAHPVFGRLRIQVAGQNIESLAVPVGPPKTLNVLLRADAQEGCPSTANVSAAPVEPWAIILAASTQADFTKPQTIKNLTPGKIRVYANNLGDRCFQVNDAVADLSGDAPPLVEIKLAGAGAVHGTIHPGTAGSRVVLTPTGADSYQTRTAWTDPAGHFDFEGLRPGNYRIAASNTREVEIEVKSGAPTEVDLAAVRREGQPQ